jgi:hypothetical protein
MQEVPCKKERPKVEAGVFFFDEKSIPQSKPRKKYTKNNSNQKYYPIPDPIFDLIISNETSQVIRTVATTKPKT